jgi:predicted RNA-binding protein with TRAM domain
VELNDCMSSDWAESYDTPMVAVDDNGDGAGRLVGYITSVTGMGHGVSECDEITARLHHAMTQRVSAERSDDDVVLRLIGRQHGALVRWALTQAGLRLQRQATLMVRGEYAEPHGGVYVPSVMY